MSNSLQIAKYRWEFIRRNDEYRKDWSSFFANADVKIARSLLKKWGFLNFPQSNDFDKPWDEINRIKGTIWTRELDGYPFWEELKNFIIQAMFKYSGNKAYVVTTPELLGDVVVENNMVISNETTTAEKYHLRSGDELVNLKATNIPDKITIQICNFKKYLSGNDIEQHAFRERVIEVVNQQFKLWESASRKLNMSTTRKYRHRFEEYSKHLQIWDLALQHGKNWKKIAGIAYPKSVSVNSDINKAKASYRQACKLIKNAKNLFIEK
jgi:hypothetical protein